jgi:hypothetical protein
MLLCSLHCKFHSEFPKLSTTDNPITNPLINTHPDPIDGIPITAYPDPIPAAPFDKIKKLPSWIRIFSTLVVIPTTVEGCIPSGSSRPCFQSRDSPQLKGVSKSKWRITSPEIATRDCVNAGNGVFPMDQFQEKSYDEMDQPSPELKTSR